MISLLDFFKIASRMFSHLALLYYLCVFSFHGKLHTKKLFLVPSLWNFFKLIFVPLLWDLFKLFLVPSLWDLFKLILVPLLWDFLAHTLTNYAYTFWLLIVYKFYKFRKDLKKHAKNIINYEKRDDTTN